MKVIKQKFKAIISGIKDRSAHVRHSVTPERMRAACEFVRTVLTLLDRGTWS
ncbi:hypothetical protein AB0N97_38135 [Streptomyces collinus]|uniref:hypothetical protein n=1 Tax=Streptomyces TaxID=1883 RepID=UPI003413D282